MLRRRRRPARRAKSRRLFVESLETRRLLAGDVAATISGGSLIINGDADDNDISIVADAVIPGRVTITPNGTTTLNGVAIPQVFQATSDIRLRMRDGADMVTYDGAGGSAPRDLTFDGGDGDNTFNIFNYSIGRNLRVSNDDGQDDVDIVDLMARSVSVSNGDGGSTTDVLGATSLSNDLWIKSGDDGGLGNSVVIDGASIDGDLMIQNGDGTTTIDIDAALIGDDVVIRNGDGGAAIAFGALLPVDVLDDVIITNGDGANVISIVDGSIGDDLFVRNGDGGAATAVDGTQIGGDINVNNGNGDNIAVFDAVDVGASLTVRNRDGDNTIAVGSGAIGRDLRLSNGDGDYTIDLADLGTLSVAGRLFVRNGDGAALGAIRLGNASVDGDVQIRNGDGDNTLQVGAFGGAAEIGRTLFVSNGDGDNTVLVDNSMIGGSLIVRNGVSTSSHTTSLGATGSLQVGLDVRFISIGDNFFEAIGVDFGRMLDINTRSGNDTINLGGTSAVGDFRVGGRTNIHTGDGDDLLNMGVDLSAITEFVDPVRIRMGRDSDTVTIGEATIIDALASSFDGGPPNDPASDVITVTNSTAFDPFDPAIRRRIVNFELILD